MTRWHEGDTVTDSNDMDAQLAHVLLALLVLAARLATRFGIPLRDVKRAMELAYYRESRNRGMTMREMVELMSVSMRKISQLSSELKATYLRHEVDASVERRITALLLAGPMSQARIVQALAGEAEADVVGALAALVDAARVAVTDERTLRFVLSTPHHRLYREPWQARLDGLEHLVRGISGAVEQRFFGDGTHAFARTIAFRVAPDDVARLAALYEESVFPLTTQLEARAKDAAVPVNLVVAWSKDDERV